jgi:hypothetical protein
MGGGRLRHLRRLPRPRWWWLHQVEFQLAGSGFATRLDLTYHLLRWFYSPSGSSVVRRLGITGSS